MIKWEHSGAQEVRTRAPGQHEIANHSIAHGILSFFPPTLQPSTSTTLLSSSLSVVPKLIIVWRRIDPGHGAQGTHLGHCDRGTHTPWTCTTEQLHIPTALASSFTFTLSALSIPEQQNTSGSNTNLSETTIQHVKQTLDLVARPSLVSRPLSAQYFVTC